MPPIARKLVPVSHNTLTQSLPTNGIWSRIKPMDLDWDNFFLKMLIYGEVGTGKTSIASTWPSPILWLICSGGTVKPDELWSVNTPENQDRIYPVMLQNTDEIKELVDGWKPDTFKSVIVDHLTGCQDMFIKEVLGLEKMPEQKSFQMMSIEKWGIVAQLFKEAFASMLNIPANVLWLSHETVFKPKDSNSNYEFDSEITKDYVGPNLTPKVAGWVCGAMNYVCQAYRTKKIIKTKEEVLGEVREVTQTLRGANYMLRCQEMTGYASKCRLPRQWAERKQDLVNPSYARFMAMLKGQELPPE